jgi:1,4-dihydroxy-2-naphthoate polyprenyltransferase
VNRYVEAARPRTLPAAVTPVVVGTAAALRPVGDLHLDRAVLALVVALALQVAVNYANDLFDGISGVDTEDRTGPRRAIASGLITPSAMKRATAAALGVAAVAGLVLAWQVGWELLLVGAFAILATLGYSGGRKPYASRGLGEISVFVFFGVVATAGSAYVQDGVLTTVPLLASIPVGALAVALLVVNNLRDIPTDAAAGKRTLAVRLGEAATRGLYRALVVVAFVGVVVIAAVVDGWWPLLGLVALPLAIVPVRAVGTAPLGRELIPILEATGRIQLLLGVGLAAGLALAPLAGGGTVLLGAALAAGGTAMIGGG